MFARALWFDERYQIKEEQFDPADVVQIPAEPSAQGLLVGLLSLDSAAQREFDLTLHTELAEVYVRRLGAGHRIGVSMWAIVSKMPVWLASTTAHTSSGESRTLIGLPYPRLRPAADPAARTS